MKLLFSFVLLFMFNSILFGGEMLKVGDTAPVFELSDSEGTVHRLADYKGGITVIYFYPKDDSPGCTKEACNLRDNYEALLNEGISILGISYDDSASHKNFSEKYNLPFPLLSDNKRKVADLYGADRGLLNMLGPKRITYIIDPNGKVLHVFDKVDSGNHASQILEIVTASKKNK